MPGVRRAQVLPLLLRLGRRDGGRGVHVGGLRGGRGGRNGDRHGGERGDEGATSGHCVLRMGGGGGGDWPGGRSRRPLAARLQLVDSPPALASRATWTGKPRACWTSCRTTARARRGGSCWTSSTRTACRWRSSAGRRGAAAGAACPSSGCSAASRATAPARSPSGRASTLETLQATRRALGLPVPVRTSSVLGEEDLEAARDPGAVRDAGFDDRGPAGDQPRARARDGALRRGAAHPIAESLLEPGADEHELGRASRPGRRAACRSTRRGWTTSSGCTCARCCATRRSRFEERAAGRGEERTAGDRVRRPRRLHRAGRDRRRRGAERRRRRSLQRLAGEVVEPPVRLVKVIGDAVMLVAPEPEPTGRHGGPARRARGGDRGLPAAARRRGLRPGRQPLGRLVRLDGQPRQPPDRARAARAPCSSRRRCATRVEGDGYAMVLAPARSA